MSLINSINYNNNILYFKLTRKRVKNINLRISANGISISAPSQVPIKKINEFVLSKADWILTAQKKFQGTEAPVERSVEYNNGDKIMLLGKPLTLIVRKSPIEGVELFTDEAGAEYILLQIKDTDNLKRKKLLLDKWKTAKCEEIFKKISDEVFLSFREYYPSITLPILKYREMTSRWGSCQTQNGIITLNKRLLENPYPAIEYVIVHEYAHFIIPNHSKQFYLLVEKFLPDYKLRKKLL